MVVLQPVLIFTTQLANSKSVEKKQKNSSSNLTFCLGISFVYSFSNSWKKAHMKKAKMLKISSSLFLLFLQALGRHIPLGF